MKLSEKMDIMLQEISSINTTLKHNSEVIDELKKKIYGNGQPGLEQDVEKLKLDIQRGTTAVNVFKWTFGMVITGMGALTAAFIKFRDAFT